MNSAGALPENTTQNQHSQQQRAALDSNEYDAMWHDLPDFIKYNPGSRHRRRMITSILKRIQFQTLLDVGCGNAELIHELNRVFGSGVRMEGAEYSPEVVRQNERRFPTIPFHVIDVEKAPLPQQYDLVTCSEVIEHLNDVRAAFTTLAAMVKPGGHLLVTCPTGPMYATEKHFGHTRHPNLLELHDHAARTGLTVAKSFSWGFPTFRTMKWATNVNAEWALRNFATGAYTPAARALANVLYYANFLNVSSPWGCQLVALMRRDGGAVGAAGR
ncbi:MAG: class I SAM-dependent methyltransferase [Planctomycetota bacterium]|nr:class I SAM-dependent methyltransferase [Planctomycetota bacterium]